MAKKKDMALNIYLGIFLSLGFFATYFAFQIVTHKTIPVDNTVAAVTRVETGCAVAFDEVPYLAIGDSKKRICELVVGQRVKMELTVHIHAIYGVTDEATLSVVD